MYLRPMWTISLKSPPQKNASLQTGARGFRVSLGELFTYLGLFGRGKTKQEPFLGMMTTALQFGLFTRFAVFIRAQTKSTQMPCSATASGNFARPTCPLLILLVICWCCATASRSLQRISRRCGSSSLLWHQHGHPKLVALHTAMAPQNQSKPKVYLTVQLVVDPSLRNFNPKIDLVG